MRLYLAGPMTGHEHWNFPAFDEAAARLRAAGHVVISPADLDRGEGFDERSVVELPAGFMAAAVRRDLEALLKVEAVALLPGWERSKGTTLELRVARALDLDVFTVGRVYIDRDMRGDYWTTLHPLDVDAEREAVNRARAADEVVEVDPDAIDVEQRLAPYVIDRGEDFLPAGSLSFGSEVRVVDASGGAKGAKLARFDMIPPDVLHELAEHYGHGEAKYPSDPETGEANWQLGYRWSLSVAALHRHLNAWQRGEDVDPELGDSHLIAVAWHAFALRWWQLHGRGTDDVRRGVA